MSTDQLKPPQEENVFHMELVNSGNRDLWFIWTDRKNKLTNGIVTCQGQPDSFAFHRTLIDCKKYGGGGNLCILQFFGEDTEDRFYALFLRANSQVTCKKYPLISWGKLEKLTFHVVASVLVDGKTPLEEWLPYDSGNRGKIFYDSEDYSSELDGPKVIWKPGKGVEDIKRLRVSTIQYRPLATWVWSADADVSEK